LKLVIATDAWEPQVNGVVRTLQATIREMTRMGLEVEVIHPGRFRTFAMPSYPDIRLAVTWPRRMCQLINEIAPDAIHLATEGPVGWAMRSACLKLGRRFTASYHTRFPEYLSARAPVPEAMAYALLRRFHAPAAAVLVSTPTVTNELKARGFKNLAMWSRGVDTALFHPDYPSMLDLPRPIFVTVARLAVEKNIPAFLDLDLPGSKVVVGDGPMAAELRDRYPKALFTGMKTGSDLAAIYASSDVFVFPSLTDTYGIVMLEATASGLPVAAYPVAGPIDVIGPDDPGVLDPDLKRACMGALRIPREDARAFALRYSWAAATEMFLANVMPSFVPRTPLNRPKPARQISPLQKQTA
jgi:glycosyltransferase involved in cell wall biosynthesis